MKFENINSKLGGPFEREKPRRALYGSQLTREVSGGRLESIVVSSQNLECQNRDFSTQNSITENSKTDTSRNWESSKLRSPKTKKFLNLEAQN